MSDDHKIAVKKKVSSSQISTVPVGVNVNLIGPNGERIPRQLVASASSLKLVQDKTIIEWSKPSNTVFRFNFVFFV
jgi:hypothetical protein